MISKGIKKYSWAVIVFWCSWIFSFVLIIEELTIYWSSEIYDFKGDKKYSWVIIVFWYSWIFSFVLITHALIIYWNSWIFDFKWNKKSSLNIFIPKIIGCISLSRPQPLMLRTRLGGHSLLLTLKFLPSFFSIEL